MNIKEVKTTAEHVKELCQNMRLEDRREVVALTGNPDVYNIVLAGWLQSDYCKTILLDDKVVFIYGVIPVPDMPSVGSPYMLGTELLKEIKMPFLRNCRNRVSYMKKKYKYLFNWIDSRNELHLRFIKWCGFKIINEKEVNDVKFHGFCMGEQ